MNDEVAEGVALLNSRLGDFCAVPTVNTDKLDQHNHARKLLYRVGGGVAQGVDRLVPSVEEPQSPAVVQFGCYTLRKQQFRMGDSGMGLIRRIARLATFRSHLSVAGVGR